MRKCSSSIVVMGALVLGLFLGSGCGPVLSKSQDGGGSSSGQGGGAGRGAAGSAGASDAGGFGVICGPVQCQVGMVCCNAGCGICTPPGGACVAGCAAGGTFGHGGAAAHGPTGAAGSSGGTGGPRADGGVSCADLASQYAAALPAALRCDLGSSGECKSLVSVTLAASYCGLGCQEIYVNDAAALTSIQSAAQQDTCNVGVACPAILCSPPTMGTCIPADGGGGVCSSANTSAAPTN